MRQLKDSISEYGVRNPLIVIPRPEGVYEIFSGHRRKYATQKLGYTKLPVIIRVMTDDEAIIAKVDSIRCKQGKHYSQRHETGTVPTVPVQIPKLSRQHNLTHNADESSHFGHTIPY